MTTNTLSSDAGSTSSQASGTRQHTELTLEERELIALGAAIAANCEPCFAFHHDKARQIGLSSGAMREAVRIGTTVQTAAAKHILGIAERALAAEAPVAASAPCCVGKPDKSDTSSCC